MRQYETIEFSYRAEKPTGSEAVVDLSAQFIHAATNTKKTVTGFYAGNGIYKVRFFPEKSGIYEYKIGGILTDSGSFSI